MLLKRMKRSRFGVGFPSPSDELLHSASGYVADVDRTVRTNSYTVCHGELPVVVAIAADAGNDRPIQAHNDHGRPVWWSRGLIAAVGDESNPVCPERHSVWSAKRRAFPFAEVATPLVEYLDASVASVSYIHSAARVKRDPVRKIELSWSASFCAPLE